MMKSRAVGSQSDPLKNKKLNKATGLNEKKQKMMGKKKQKNKREADDEVCVPVDENTEKPQTTLEDLKKKKRKFKDSEAAVPESDEAAEEKQKNSKKSKTESSGDANASPQPEASGEEDENSSDEEEELSPEEKRVLERKMKKILKKEEKKKLREEGKSIKPEKSQTMVAEKQALEYLTCWSERREEWKFQKTRQTWLLQHMYDSGKVPDDKFEVLLSYLEGLRGAARDITQRKAEAIVRWEGQGEEADTPDAEKKKLRAKQIIQML